MWVNWISCQLKYVRLFALLFLLVFCVVPLKTALADKTASQVYSGNVWVAEELVDFLPSRAVDQWVGYLDKQKQLPELKGKLAESYENLLQHIKMYQSTASQLDWIRMVANSDEAYRSGQEFGIKAQGALFIIGAGAEASVGTYTGKGFKGVPYFRIAPTWALSMGKILGANVTANMRIYTKKSAKPSPSFLIDEEPENYRPKPGDLGQSAHSYGGILAVTEQNAHYVACGDLICNSDSFDSRGSVQEKGVGVGFGHTRTDNNGGIRIPLFFGSKYFSKKGRLLMKAEKLEKKLAQNTLKLNWKKIDEKIFPEYQAVVEELYQRVLKKNSHLLPEQVTISKENPFSSIRKLILLGS